MAQTCFLFGAGPFYGLAAAPQPGDLILAADPAAGKCDFDIDIFYNRMIIDAKSILGILSMDLNNVLTVHCYGEDPEFSNTLRKFAVA